MHTIPFNGDFASVFVSPPPSHVPRARPNTGRPALEQDNTDAPNIRVPANMHKDPLMNILIDAFDQLRAKYPDVGAFNEEDMRDFLRCVWTDLESIEAGRHRAVEPSTDSEASVSQPEQWHLGGVIHFGLRMVQGRFDFWQEQLVVEQSADEMIWAAFRELIEMLIKYAEAQGTSRPGIDDAMEDDAGGQQGEEDPNPFGEQGNPIQSGNKVLIYILGAGAREGEVRDGEAELTAMMEWS